MIYKLSIISITCIPDNNYTVTPRRVLQLLTWLLAHIKEVLDVKERNNNPQEQT